MNGVLQEFVKNDSGFEQYAERYEDISSDLFVRRQFAAWSAEMDIAEIWKAEGKAEGKAEERAESTKRMAEERAESIRRMAEEKDNSAKRMLMNGISLEIIADCLDMPLSRVQELAIQTANL